MIIFRIDYENDHNLALKVEAQHRGEPILLLSGFPFLPCLRRFCDMNCATKQETILYLVTRANHQSKTQSKAIRIGIKALLSQIAQAAQAMEKRAFVLAVEVQG